jgi:hypothetical protein
MAMNVSLCIVLKGLIVDIQPKKSSRYKAMIVWKCSPATMESVVK